MRPVSLAVGGGLLVLALGAFAVSTFTAGKLRAGKMIRGELPGATRFEASVLTMRRLGAQCELTLRADGREFREWADAADCPRYSVGGGATVARTPDDDELYLVHGTWASAGNGEFDAGLLVVERAIAAALALSGLVGAAAGLRRRAKPPIPPARVV